MARRAPAHYALRVNPAEDQCAEFLRARPDAYFCAPCLAVELGLTVQDVQEALSGLRRFADFDMRSARCSFCLSAIVAIRAVPPPP